MQLRRWRCVKDRGDLDAKDGCYRVKAIDRDHSLREVTLAKESRGWQWEEESSREEGRYVQDCFVLSPFVPLQSDLLARTGGLDQQVDWNW